jgi:hypothetical protein
MWIAFKLVYNVLAKAFQYFLDIFEKRIMICNKLFNDYFSQVLFSLFKT